MISTVQIKTRVRKENLCSRKLMIHWEGKARGVGSGGRCVLDNPWNGSVRNDSVLTSIMNKEGLLEA